jgi:hypothetical protein
MNQYRVIEFLTTASMPSHNIHWQVKVGYDEEWVDISGV